MAEANYYSAADNDEVWSGDDEFMREFNSRCDGELFNNCFL